MSTTSGGRLSPRSVCLLAPLDAFTQFLATSRLHSRDRSAQQVAAVGPHHVMHVRETRRREGEWDRGGRGFGIDVTIGQGCTRSGIKQRS